MPSSFSSRPWRRAAAWLALLGPFFFLSYGLANWWTARLPLVGSLVFGWERRIPFWPWTIVPYLSLDALYAGSLFLCASRAELGTHARRLLLASGVSVAGFLLFPLRFSFGRPAVQGWAQGLFAALAGLDKPFNQAPSLHMSLVLLVGLVWQRHLRGVARAAALGWFGLIALSVLTTYQHHFIDVVAGAAVGVLCVYVLPDAPFGTSLGAAVGRTQRSWRRKLALAYGLGAALCLAGAGGLGGWAWLLLWPALALLAVAGAYAGWGVAVFQKQHGQLSWAARVVLLPYRLGAWGVVALVHAPGPAQCRSGARHLAGPRPRPGRLAAPARRRRCSTSPPNSACPPAPAACPTAACPCSIWWCPPPPSWRGPWPPCRS